MGFMDTVSSVASSMLKGVGADKNNPTETGKILKMQITAYQDITFTKVRGDIPLKEGFHVELPLLSSDNGISQKFKIKWNGGENGGSAQGESAPMHTFGGYLWDSDGMSIKIIVDATGVFVHDWSKTHKLINYEKPNISDYLEYLRKVVYSYYNESHEAPYLKLIWSEAIISAHSAPTTTVGTYPCVLEEMEVNYDLFSQQGVPVRAEVNLKFKPCIDPNARPLGASPDLSHIIEIKYGDNLPKLCQDIYDSPEYYHQVAKVNGLQSAYDLEPGMRLLFPPLDKFDR